MTTRLLPGKNPSDRSKIFYGWYIVGAGMGIHLWVSMAWIYGMQVFFTPIVETFGWSRAIISGAFALQRLEGSIASPVEGFLVDKFGPRPLVLFGAILSGSGLIMLSFLQSIWMFYVCVLLVSLGISASVGIPRSWAIVQWFRRSRGRALGIGSSGAVLSGPLLIIVVRLVEGVGWRPAFLILGIATWLICIPLGMVFRSRPELYGLAPDGDSLPSEQLSMNDPSQNKRNPLLVEDSMTIRDALKTNTFWILALVFGAQTMGVSGLIVHLIPYLQTIGFSSSEAASVLAIYTVLSVFGRLGGGLAMDYIDPRLVLSGLLACMAVGILILANLSSYWQVFPFALLYGTAFGGMIPARSVLVSMYFGTKNFGALQGLTQSVTVIAGMTSPVLLGIVFDLTESYLIALYILVAISGLAIPVALLARPPR